MKRDASSGSVIPRIASSRAVTADTPSACASAAAAAWSCGFVFQIGGTAIGRRRVYGPASTIAPERDRSGLNDADRTHLAELVVTSGQARLDVHGRDVG